MLATTTIRNTTVKNCFSYRLLLPQDGTLVCSCCERDIKPEDIDPYYGGVQVQPVSVIRSDREGTGVTVKTATLQTATCRACGADFARYGCD